MNNSKCNLPTGAIERETSVNYFGRDTSCRYWSVGNEVVRAEVSFKQLNGKHKFVDITEAACDCFWIDEALHDDLANQLNGNSL